MRETPNFKSGIVDERNTQLSKVASWMREIPTSKLAMWMRQIDVETVIMDETHQRMVVDE
jgi:hypothetical protein